MDDANQIEVPPSFTALFTTPSGHRLTQPIRFVRERYELCEDLAQMLSDTPAVSAHASTAELQGALADSGAELQPEEAGWVATRVAELLGWTAVRRAG